MRAVMKAADRRGGSVRGRSDGRRGFRRPIAAFRVPPSQAGPKSVFVTCHYCGYSPSGEVPTGGMCPKCGGYSWERFALSRRLLPETVVSDQ